MYPEAPGGRRRDLRGAKRLRPRRLEGAVPRQRVARGRDVGATVANRLEELFDAGGGGVVVCRAVLSVRVVAFLSLTKA